GDRVRLIDFSLGSLPPSIAQVNLDQQLQQMLSMLRIRGLQQEVFDLRGCAILPGAIELIEQFLVNLALVRRLFRNWHLGHGKPPENASGTEVRDRPAVQLLLYFI